MKETGHNEEIRQSQEQHVHSDTPGNAGRVYRSEHGGERRIGRLTQTVYGEGEVPHRVRRAQEQSVVRQSEPTERPVRRAQQQETQSSVKNTAQQQETQNRVKNTEQKSAVREQRPQQSTGGWKEKLQTRRKLKARMILGGVLGMVAVAYIAVAVYFGFHFYEGTVIYGIDCSQLTVEEAKQEVAEKLDQYVLSIRERENRTETLTAEQIGLKFVDNSSIDRMLRSQRCYIWPVMMLLERDPMVSVAFEYDEQLVENAMNQMDCFDTLHAVDPKNAYVLTTETGFVIEKEIMGTTLDHDKTLEVVMAALDAGKQEISLEDNGCYIDPEVYGDDEEMIRTVEAKNELVKAQITYDFGVAQEVVNALVIDDWIVELDDGSFVIDDSHVYEYVEAMAAKYDTFGLPVTFYTSLGTSETLSGGDYGWCIDQDQTVLELLQALESGYQGTMEPAYLYTGMSHENNGIGYTYVEICISQQRMWCYENGYCVVDTPVVTGNPNKGNGTPSGGVWAIDAKKRDAILEGEGYAEPVDYWMPFNGDIGIHDLKERAYFGSTIYLTNGSHGCVNTPYEAVQTIYNTVSIGTPVIVYE